MSAEARQEPLRLAIVGCGRVVERYYLPALAALPAVTPVAAVEIDAARRAWIRARLPGIAIADTLAVVLDPARIDAVLIATPPATHAELARHCLAARLAVLVEKPLATSTAAAEAAVAAAADAARPLVIGFNRRFHPSWQAARRALAATDAAGLTSARLTFVSDAGRWAGVPADAEAALAALLDDIVPHQIDLLGWLFARAPVHVTAGAVTFAPGRALSFAFEVGLAGGLRVACRAGYGPAHVELFEVGAGGRTFLAHRAWAGWVGAGATIARGLAKPHARLADAWRQVSGRPSPTRESFEAEVRAFAAAVCGRPTPDLADGAAGLRACRAVEGLRTSLGNGRRPVTIEQRGDQER